MTLVKPPAFKELIKTYGSPKAAIQHLLDSGFTAEEIEWRVGIPYYFTRLTMEDIHLSNPVQFSTVVKTYERLALLRSKKGKETELTKFFQRSDLPLETKTRLALGTITEESLKVGPGTVERATSLATGEPMRKVAQLLRDYGEHGEVIFLLKKEKEARLTVEEVYEAIKLLPRISKITERNLHIASLLRVSTPVEAKYIARLLLDDLKLGYHHQTVIRAAAKAHEVSPELIEGACAILGIAEGIMLAPEGELKLSAVKLRPGQFMKPQLAHLYEPDRVAYPVRAEYKLDGSRLQIHKWGTQIRLFSRNAIEKSQTLPEIVEIAERFQTHSCVVDSEIIAVDESGALQPFQTLLKRTISTKSPGEDWKRENEKATITVKAFDIVFVNGRELTSLPLSERREYLVEIVPPEYLTDGKNCENEVELMRFYEEALHRGFEGVVMKTLDSRYEAGKRTYSWLKLKPERDTIDCTFVKALFGKGRRAGLYSSFLMAVRDPEKKELYSIGRVSNLPENVMVDLGDVVERTRVAEDEEGVIIKPSVVVEATYQEIQESNEYTSGYSLRVPKVVRFRHDKRVEEIDDVKRLQKLYELQYERYPLNTL